VRNRKRILQAFGGHQIEGQDCCNNLPTIKGAYSVSGDMLVWTGLPFPGYGAGAKQSPHVLNLAKQSGDQATYVLGTSASCLIPDARTYEISMWGFVPTQSGTTYTDLRVAVIWQDGAGFHNQLQYALALDEWNHFHFKNIVVGRGAFFFFVVIYNLGGNIFGQAATMLIDRMEMWDKGDIQHAPGHEDNNSFVEDRMWERTERLLVV